MTPGHEPAGLLVYSWGLLIGSTLAINQRRLLTGVVIIIGVGRTHQDLLDFNSSIPRFARSSTFSFSA